MKGIEAKRKLAALDNKISKAYERIEFSEKRFDLHGITFSAVKIKEAIEQIKGDEMFPQNDVERYQEQIVLICQRTIQIFDSWLLRQGPRGRTIKDASDFERYMRETSLNLKKLGLDETADKAERHLAKAMHHINTLAEAQALTENIETWLTSIIADRAQESSI